MNTLTHPATASYSEAAVVCQRYDVVGMTCSHCEHAVAAEVSALPGVTAVTADAAAGTVIIESARELDRSEVASAVAEAGYELAR
jgi:copper chaperone CopZ